MNFSRTEFLKASGRLLAIACFLLAGWLIGINGYFVNSPSTTANSVVEQNEVETVSVMFDYGNGTVKTLTDISVEESETVFNVLNSLNESQKIKMSYKDFGGDLGFFIQSIDSIPADSSATDKWWQFWVNNVYSTIGAGSYQVSPGDVIEFKFTQGQLTY